MASEDYTWLLNGVDLDAATAGLGAATLWRPPISTRRSVVEVPGRHGSATSGLPVFAEPQITLVIRADRGSQAALEAAVTTIAGLLGQPTLTATRVSGGVSATARAELVSADMDADFLPGGFARPTAVLALPDVFFAGPPQLSGVVSLAGGKASEVVLPHLAGSSAPHRGVVLRVRGPLSSVGVSCRLTGTGISWSGAALDSDAHLYLEPDRLRAWVSGSGVEWWPGRTGTHWEDRSAGVDWPAAGRLQMWPEVVGLAVPSRVRIAASTQGHGPTTGLAVWAGRSFL